MKTFFGSLLVVSAICLLVYGIYCSIISSNKAEIERQQQFNSIHELTNIEIASESEVCTKAGLDIKLNKTYNQDTYESKVVSVSCVPRENTVIQQGNNDLQKAVVTAGAIYVGSKVIGHLLK